MRRIGCYDLNENNAFSVLLGSATNQIECRLNQPIEVQTSNGLLCKRGGISIIKFGGDDDNKTQAYQDIHMNSNSITDLREPTAAQDVATKNYVNNSTGPVFRAVGTSQTNASGEKIKVHFDRILVNSGLKYDSKLSRFKLGKRGAYFLNAAVVCKEKGEHVKDKLFDCCIYLYKNDSLLSEIASGRIDAYKIIHLRGSTLSPLSKTDHVEIYAYTEKDVELVE